MCKLNDWHAFYSANCGEKPAGFCSVYKLLTGWLNLEIKQSEVNENANSITNVLSQWSSQELSAYKKHNGLGLEATFSLVFT